MAKTSGEIENEFLIGLKPATGKDLKEWLSIIKNSGIQKRNDMVKWLKTDHSFGHMNASLLVGIYLNNGNPVYKSEVDLLENQLSKYEALRPLFEYVSSRIIVLFPDTKMIPKKTYISFTAKREFAAINIKSKELRLGMDLGDMAYTETLEKAKLTGPMPRIGHMVMLTQKTDFDTNVEKWLQTSYNRVNI
jgi:predicted transport protein